MDFENAPTLLVAYFTPITASSPGIIGFFGQVGTVQPQLPFAREIIIGDFPTFLKWNSLFPSAFC